MNTKMKRYGKIAYDGLITNNATFKLVLGTCATLGMSTSAVNSFGMGLSVKIGRASCRERV